MANSKISALAAATTPLAGTEVLPVVQSGVTKQVSVANLTVGRAVAAASLETTGKIGVSVTAASGIGQLSNTSTAWAGGNATDGFVWRSVQNDWTATVLGTPASGAGYGLRLHTLGTTTSDYPLFISSGTSAGTAKFTVQGDGTTTFTGGNLVIGTAGKGIDFSANSHAAGMTSELLTWYEQGTFTPTDTSGAGLTLTVSKAVYTRIGNTVVAYIYVTYPTTANGSGARIGGLPFSTAGTNYYMPFPILTNSGVSVYGYTNQSSTEVWIMDNANNVIPNSTLSGKFVIITATYFA